VAALSRTRLLPLLQPAAPPAPARRHHRPEAAGEWHAGFPFRLLLLLGLLPLLLLTSIVLVYREQQADKIYAGVTALGVGLGRMTPEQAARALKTSITSASRRPLQLRYDDDAFTTSLATLGLRVEDDEIGRWAEQAWNVGRDTDLRSWLRTQLALMRRGQELPVTLSFDRDRAAAALGRVAIEVERQPVNAGLTVEKAGDQFEIHRSPAKTGRRLNVPATLDRLQGALHNELPTHLDIVLDEAFPAISDADVAPAAEALRHMLGSQLELKDGARSWTLTPTQAFPMLEITGLEAGQPPVTPRLNEEKLRAFIDGVARQATITAVNPAFDVVGDRITIRPGTTGKTMDGEATLALLKERLVSPTRTLDVVFAEDKPWLTEADLTPARDQANTLLDRPITLETPPQPGQEVRSWRLDRPLLAQMLVLPNTQTVTREFRTLQPSQRPSFEIQLDSGKVTNYLAREIAPWVSEDPVDAQLQLRTVVVDAPGTPTTPGTPGAPATSRPPAEGRPLVELRNAKDGRGPDYLGTFSAMQALFKIGAPAGADERKVTVRLTTRPPRVQDVQLAAARDQANRLIGEPVIMRWESLTWTVTREELAAMLRYQTAGTGMTAYLARDALLARATTIARDLERQPQLPRDATGKPRTVDVPATASNLWIQASTVERNRAAEVVLAEPDEPAPAQAPQAAPTPSGGQGASGA
jgi:vancomycin resistance protein YoaR